MISRIFSEACNSKHFQKSTFLLRTCCDTLYVIQQCCWRLRAQKSSKTLVQRLKEDKHAHLQVRKATLLLYAFHPHQRHQKEGD